MHPETICRVFSMYVTNKEYHSLSKRINKFRRNPKQYTYSFLNLPLMCLNIPYERKKSYVCSSFVTYILKDIIKPEKNFTLVTPNDYNYLNLDLEYEGNLKNFYEKCLGSN